MDFSMSTAPPDDEAPHGGASHGTVDPGESQGMSVLDSHLLPPLSASPAGSKIDCSGRSLLDRTFGRLTVGGVRHSMLTLSSTALGGGVLSVPYVMSLAGVVVGTCMIISGGILAFISLKILMNLSRETNHSTYAGLLAHCAGPMAAPMLDVLLFVYGNGSCVGFMVFLGDFIPALVSLGGSSVPAWLSSREVAIVGSALLVLPMALQRDTAVLRYVTPVSILGLVYMALVVAIKSPDLYQQHQGDSTYGPVRWANPTLHLFDAFAICVFAFNCHLNVLPVAGSMVRPTKSRIVKVSALVNMIQIVFYCLIGITGYVSFLAHTPGDIIKGYPAKEVAVAVGRVLLSGTMLVAVPVNLHPTVSSALQIWDFFHGRPVPPPSPPESPSPNNSPRRMSTLSVTPGGPCLRYLATVLCITGQAVIAIVVPDVATVIGLLGATVATAIMLALPAYCLGVVTPRTARVRLIQALLYFCAVLSMASVPVKILTWARVID